MTKNGQRKFTKKMPKIGKIEIGKKSKTSKNAKKKKKPEGK